MTIVVTKEIGWQLVPSNLEVKAISSDVEGDMLNSLSKQSALREWLPRVFNSMEKLPPMIIVDNKKGVDLSNQCVNGWIPHIREELYANPLVEDIFVSIEDSDVDVWVVIPERDLAVLDQLADIEWGLLELFVSGAHPPFLIDFHIIYRCGRNVEDLAPTRAIKLPR